MERTKGIQVAPGVVIGRAFVLEEVLRRVPYHTVKQADVKNEVWRLATSVELAIAELEADRDRAAEKLGPEPAKIFEFHIGLLQDSMLIDPIRERICK